mgnify:CR=1 FL=1
MSTSNVSASTQVLASADDMRQSLRRISHLKGRQPTPEATDAVLRLVGDGPYRHDLLIEYLHLLNDAHGGLREGHLVALARLMPGKAGQPIRALAILYCDIFRGLPAVVTLYLIGFGIPTSGLPEMIMPHIVGWFVDLSSMSVAEQRAMTRIPVIWWCILALTLT